MTVKERLIIYLDYKKETKSAFGRKIGVSAAYITSMRKSRRFGQKVGVDYIKINKNKPEFP